MSLSDLAWLIPAGPFLAFVLISLGGHRSQRLSKALALAGIVVAVVLSQAIFWSLVRVPDTLAGSVIHWFSQGVDSVELGVFVDPTDAVMLAMVSFVCLMIFVYSLGYMRGDPKVSRFFAYVSLFAGAMLGAMVCDNLLAFFVFWEIMGTCSYLLIGFWWEKQSAVDASLKAFLVTKTGDLFLLLGVVLLYAQVGSLSYADLFSAETVELLAGTPYLGQMSVATVAILLLFGGTIGKSAQLPLHVWLPDAMEGPTPASALIHAATMVSAGVYLMIRAFPLLAVSQAMPAVATVGAATAVFAATIALTQSDIKRVLAFSTISQLGYMVAALGIGAYEASLFHLITHAFFKSLLFMAAGSVIHGIEHGHRHTMGHAVPANADAMLSNPNDMWKMGGLAFRMPVTAVSFLAGSLALSGFPLVTAGFWSKDEILASAWTANRPIFWALLSAAVLTGFYSARQIGLVFLGKPRTRAATYARENRAVMVVPLAILALFAIGLGWVGISGDFPLLGRWFPGWFGPFVERSIEGVGEVLQAGAAAEAVSSQLPLLFGLLASLGGLFAGWWVYGRKPVTVTGPAGAADGVSVGDPVQLALARVKLGWLYQVPAHQYYFNELYQWLVVRPAVRLADVCSAIDSKAIDATVVAFARGFGQQGGVGPAVDSIDRNVFDGVVNGAGTLSRLTARLVHWLDAGLLDGLINFLTGLGRFSSGGLRLFDEGVVDGAVKATADGFGVLGDRARRMQTGLLPDYLWNAFVMILLLVAALVLFQYA